MTKQPNNKMKELIRESNKLSLEQKELYMEMAEVYYEDFSDNLTRPTLQIHLFNPQYTLDQWREFVKFPQINKYISEIVDDMITSSANKQLIDTGKGKKEVLAVKKAVMESNKIDNSGFVILRIPK